MSNTRLRASVGVLAALGFLLLGACSEADDDDDGGGGGGGDDSQTVDVAGMEEEIATDLAEDVNQPTPEVDCPDDVEPSEGEQFECTGTAQDGSQFTIDVTWTDDQGGIEAVVPPQ